MASGEAAIGLHAKDWAVGQVLQAFNIERLPETPWRWKRLVPGDGGTWLHREEDWSPTLVRERKPVLAQAIRDGRLPPAEVRSVGPWELKIKFGDTADVEILLTGGLQWQEMRALLRDSLVTPDPQTVIEHIHHAAVIDRREPDLAVSGNSVVVGLPAQGVRAEDEISVPIPANPEWTFRDADSAAQFARLVEDHFRYLSEAASLNPLT